MFRKNRKNNIKKILSKLRINKAFPLKIRSISLSLALFMLWRWLGTDTYFSIYVKEIIWNAWGVTAIWTILAFTKLLFVIPIGKMNDHVNIKYILLIWKILYVFCGVAYFLAWIFHSWILLIVATILNGMANSTTFTTYRSYYAKKSTKSDHTHISWIYFSSLYLSVVVWSLIAAFLVGHLELSYMYLFVVIFALVSLLQDQKIKTVLSNHYNRTWRRFYNRVKKEAKADYEIDEWRDSNQKFFGKKWFIHSFIKECISSDSRKEIWTILHKYWWKLYVALGSQMYVNFLNYTGFLFIPIVAMENSLSLSQIALVFAAMRLPYVVNIFIWRFGDKYSKKLLISIILVLISFLYIALWFYESFVVILMMTFFVSLWIAILNPLSSALVVSYTQPKDRWSMTWVQDFVSRAWDILGSLWFWTLTAIIGLQNWFIIVWIATFGLWSYLLIKKLLSYKSKNNEREDSEKHELQELPIPAIDAISLKLNDKSN